MATSHLGLSPTFPVLPLLSSSLTVFFAILETTVLVPFLRAAEVDAVAANRTCRLWWTVWLNMGLATIFCVVLPGVFLGIYGAWKSPSNSLEWKLYAAGAAFSFAHFIAGPAIAGVIEKICDENVERQGKTMVYLRKWLRIHAWRSLLADVPALTCYAWLVFGT